VILHGASPAELAPIVAAYREHDRMTGVFGKFSMEGCPSPPKVDRSRLER
jgi:hypothetical protein